MIIDPAIEEKEMIGKSGSEADDDDKQKQKQKQLPHPLSLFETVGAKGRRLYHLYAASLFVAISFIFFYRITHLPLTSSRWAWLGLFMAELWFSFYWFLTQFVRWNPVFRSTFSHRLGLGLGQRYEDLPGVDIFVCTADPTIEPPILVVNTVLSVMAYNYPHEKLGVYLSDDSGSKLTFYALLEASRFSNYWLPFCKKHKVEPRSPEAYFSTLDQQVSFDDPVLANDLLSIKRLYQEMKDRIETATRLGQISEAIQEEHKGFNEWDLSSTQNDHQSIIQILIDGRESACGNTEGLQLPTLVYVAREKRKQYHHHFKGGAMNALIRVSSIVSNGSIILNVDCDMYSNNSESVRDAMCFFMDKEKGHEIAYVQFRPSYDNLTKNDLYASYFRVPNELEMGGLDANGGPCYIGSACFHRRDTLCGAYYENDYEREWKRGINSKGIESATVVEEQSKILASCTYEINTDWGKEMGLKYGFASEDFVTGLAIQCRGWKSIYCNPERAGFTGLAPTTLLQSLVQHKRWSEGQFQIGLSKCCPFFYARNKIPLALQFSYSPYLFWAPNALPTLYYVLIPPLCLFKGISLFPKISSWWTVPFLYVIVTKYAYSLGEFISCGGTFKGWWNEQRMWLFRRTTSYFFAFIETILKQVGLSETGFIVTPKVVDHDVSQRYMNEVMEFGVSSPMFSILATIAMLNLFSFVWGLKTVVMGPMALQVVLCGLVVLVNLPIYEGMFFRKDNGKMPISVVYESVVLALLVCTLVSY